MRQVYHSAGDAQNRHGLSGLKRHVPQRVDTRPAARGENRAPAGSQRAGAVI
ncbi:hypothetical protein [Serratia odorifera]|uniref:Uncharacterized protein n=1 Tax=Serratia odorifera DSM 4582 TaxID=667129 RepID=D4E3F2_SEROD|nr:hypothetical protein [Serratia odorifera]EFE95728.1 hypothetical protein HMPREF0758_2702 [Serratia odorifera DSM 4582]MBJ2066064.1 hypothetical protein [Serratia odorifera]HEJ9094618.1 hypothetical protein [Serratia odorifera]